MTTVRQIRSLVAPLLERHSEFSLRGRWIFLRPVRHVVRAVLFERAGEAARFRPWWAVVNLCEPQNSIPLNWATMIRRERDGLWEWKDPLLQVDFMKAVEQQALPEMREVETLDSFVSFASLEARFPLRTFDGYLLRTVGVDIARGEFEAARAACEKLVTGKTMWSMPELRDEFIRVTGTLCPLLAADDRPGMARLLHEWEAYTVEKLGIADLWEKTPFPMEQMAGK